MSSQPLFARRGDVAARQRGAVAVEFALAVPLLAMLLLGTITAGYSYSKSLGVTNAVREGARFGASADAASGTWASDVIKRVRSTQFDDHAATKETSVCVELYKQGSGPVAGTQLCEQAGGPALDIPDSTAVPKVPLDIPADTCVVRVVASRRFEINAVIVAIPPGSIVRGSVARYEKDC